MKPFCTGDTEDVELIAAAGDNEVPHHLLNPVWLRPPLAPYAAAMLENRPIDITAARGAYQERFAKDDLGFLAGGGSLVVPLLRECSFRDLAGYLEPAVIFVACHRLGVI